MQELGEPPVVPVVRGDDPAPVFKFEQLVGNDALDGGCKRSAPRFAVVVRKEEQDFRASRIFFAVQRDPVKRDDDPSVGEFGDPCAVVVIVPSGGSFGEGTLGAPGPSAVSGFGQHDPCIGTVSVMGAFAEHAEHGSGTGQDNVGPRFVNCRVVADRIFLYCHLYSSFLIFFLHYTTKPSVRQ